DQCPNFLVSQHLVEARFLNIEDLAPQRQNSLVPPIAALLRRPAGGIALDQEQFAALRITFLTVCKFAGESAGVERAFAPGEFARLACRLAGTRRVNRLGADFAPDRGILLEVLHQLLVNEASHRRLDVAVEFALRLTLELRLRKL